ncbi:MAG: ATP-dependent helicase HrpB [Pseudomonadota bacterium]
MTALPIDDVIPEIRAALASGNRLVLAAPPGAGKTTRAPLSLLEEAWLAGKKILLLEPRRIAARMAADRMASSLGEKTGGVIGLSTRVDRKVSARTRIEVITDGLFTRRILSDPELSGVGAVLFDEFHERSLNLDLGLALALDAQEQLRPDLRLVAMSATLDTARIAKALGAPVVESDGRLHPVETIYLGRSDERIEDQTARAVRRALREQSGSVLVFLPGMGEIRRTEERLADLPSDVIVAPLYGALSPAEQDKAVSPAREGNRKVVLSTDIAESSLTIEGVDTVIDAGLARVADYDASVGGATLVTRRAARANVDQRRGRAGRLRPGVCYRLWDEEATRGLSAEPAPEILNADLSGMMLSLAEWGERDPSRLIWIDAPPAGRIKAARDELSALGAVDAEGALTPRGREMAAFPLPPRLAAMIASAATRDDRALAAEIAALIGERGLGGDSVDLRDRLERFRRDNSDRARALREQAARWGGGGAARISETGRILAAALPHFIARAKPGEAGQFQLAGGRAAQIEKSSPLAGEAWLAVAELTGSAANARILSAAPLKETEAMARVESAEIAEFDIDRRQFRAKRVRRVGAIILSETPLPKPSGAVAREALIAALSAHGFDLLDHGAVIRETQARLNFAAAQTSDPWPDTSDAALLDRAEEWLSPLLGDPPSLSKPKAEELRRGVLSLIGWSLQRQLDELAPLGVETPAGRTLLIDYLHEGGPQIEARVQEFYGISEHPAISRGKIPLAVSLLSPAQRQIALTKNLPAFWSGGYRDMAKDMRGQYPKHDWPDDPASARAHVGKTKARLKREE